MHIRLQKLIDSLPKAKLRGVRPEKPKPERKKKTKPRKKRNRPAWHMHSREGFASETPVADFTLEDCAALMLGAGVSLREIAKDLEDEDRADVYWIGTRLRTVSRRMYALARDGQRRDKRRQKR